MRARRLILAAALAVAVSVGVQSAAAGGGPDVRVKPDTVRAGEKITVKGSGFEPKARVVLLIGPPRSEALRVGAARTNAGGRFRKRLSPSPEPGRWILLACRDGCAIKTKDAFEVAPGRR